VQVLAQAAGQGSLAEAGGAAKILPGIRISVSKRDNSTARPAPPVGDFLGRRSPPAPMLVTVDQGFRGHRSVIGRRA